MEVFVLMIIMLHAKLHEEPNIAIFYKVRPSFKNPHSTPKVEKFTVRNPFAPSYISICPLRFHLFWIQPTTDFSKGHSLMDLQIKELSYNLVGYDLLPWILHCFWQEMPLNFIFLKWSM